jgi:hypothetical protein
MDEYYRKFLVLDSLAKVDLTELIRRLKIVEANLIKGKFQKPIVVQWREIAEMLVITQIEFPPETQMDTLLHKAKGSLIEVSGEEFDRLRREVKVMAADMEQITEEIKELQEKVNQLEESSR